MKSVLTLADIARLANVSRSTVSRALNDSPLLNPETKARIQAIARDHHVRINVSARNLRLRTSRTIAFVAPVYTPAFASAEDLFGLEMVGGISHGLHALGYDCLIVQRDPDDPAWAQHYLESGRVDGFILLASYLPAAYLTTLVQQQIPFIVWGLPLPSLTCCSVTGDNRTGGILGTEYLIRTGKRRIAFLGGPAESLTIQHRFDGYCEAIQAASRSVDAALVVAGDYTYASGMAAMQRLLDQAPDLDAVFVTSDLMAIAAIDVIRERGKRVPEDIAVVGYDDVAIARYNSLPLTTIRQNIPSAGQLLAQNLIHYLETGTVTTATIPVELVVRQSA